MTEIRRGRVDVLAIYKLDRLGRSLQHLAQLIGEFEAHRTALVATRSNLGIALFVSIINSLHTLPGQK
jgi:DNA invertase Pin-like site-specific DNA recombinase